MYRILVFLALIPGLLLADLVPATSEELTLYMQEAQERVLKSVADLVSAPEENVENIFRSWNRLANDISSDFRLLYFLKDSHFPCKIVAEQAIPAYQGFIWGFFMQNRSLCQFLDSWEQMPFLYFKGSAPEKQASQDLTVLTLNTCCIPGPFPFLYGGVLLPWQKRVALLSEKILEIDADIVCLQEIFAEDTTHALYAALKNRYTHFYGAIGPRVLGFDLKTLGLPSGLFVASKYAIEKPEFTLLTAVGLPMNYGVFDFVVKGGAHIYTTHMQPLAPFPEVRALQLEQIIEKMQRDQEPMLPSFLCGDLNVPFGSEEPALALIQAAFHDDYNKNQSAVDENNQTCTEYITNYLFSKGEEVDPNFQILDYALLLKTPVESHRIATQRILMNDLSKPEEALSDHHALLTTIIPIYRTIRER